MSKASSTKRASSRVKKEVDYAAMQEFKIEEVDVDDEATDDEPIVEAEVPAKKRKKGSSSTSGTDLVTEGKCGQCVGCKRVACNECSFCNSGDSENCIDLYCTNQSEGRQQREAAREAYLMSLGKAQHHDEDDDEDFIETVEDDSPPRGSVNRSTPSLSVKEQIDRIMEQVGATKNSKKQLASPTSGAKSKASKESSPADKPKKPKSDTLNKSQRSMGVYGGSSTAAKVRRCGECEGCMRDDCGQCIPCKDKPRFGGQGTKKKACVLRYCRTRKLEEDHAQANFPLNSADALKGPNRPATKLGKPLAKAEQVVVATKTEVTDELELEDAVLQD